MKKLSFLGAALLVLAAIGFAAAQWRYPVPELPPDSGNGTGAMPYFNNRNEIRVATSGALGNVLTSRGDGTAPMFLPLDFTNSSALKNTEDTDGSIFLPATEFCRADSTNLVVTRVAANDWALARTATASGEVFNIRCALDNWLQRYGGTHGIKITSISIVHSIRTTDLHRSTWGSLATVAYATGTGNNVGIDLANFATPRGNNPAPLASAVTTNPVLDIITPTTARYLPVAVARTLNVEWAVELNYNGVYRLYGLSVAFSRKDF